MIELLSGQPAQWLAEALLHFLWQGTLLVLLLKLVDPLLRSARQRYGVALVTLVLMLVMPAATCFVLTQRDQARPPSVPRSFADADAVFVAEGSIVPALPAELATGRQQAQRALVALWMLGVLVLGARLLVGYAGTLWLRGDRRALPAQLAQRVVWLGRRLGLTTRGRVFLSTRVDEAIAIGCLKPLVLIPLAWANELPASVLEAVIAHELAHIRRWDLWATLLQRLAETLLFYHPAVWWLSRRLTIERELCCDELAVAATQRRAEYALALEIVARRMSAPPLCLATSFLGGGNMNLLQRVRNVLSVGPARETAAWWPAGLAALLAPAIAALALSGWSPLASTATADDGEEAREADEREALENKLRAAQRREVVEREREAAREIEAVERELKAREAKRREAAKRERDVDEEGARERKIAESKQRDGEREEREVNRKDPPKKEVSKRDPDLDFAEFRPETEREERLLAIIRKLQAQLKETKPISKADAKGDYELEYKKALVKKFKQADEEAVKKPAKDGDERRATEEKKAAVRKEGVLKDLDAIIRKEEAVRKERDLKERKGEEKISDKEALIRKAQKELEASDSKKSGEEKEALIKKLREIKESGNKEVRKEGERKVKEGGDVESLRRALEEKDAQLRKATEALKKLQSGEGKDGERKDAPRKEGERKDDPRKEGEIRKDGDRKDAPRKDGEDQARAATRSMSTSFGARES